MKRHEIIKIIAPWWIANGWNHKSLRNMSYKQLRAINLKAAVCEWEVKKKNEAKQEKLAL